MFTRTMYKQENKAKENRKIKSEISRAVCCLQHIVFTATLTSICLFVLCWCSACMRLGSRVFLPRSDPELPNRQHCSAPPSRAVSRGGCRGQLEPWAAAGSESLQRDLAGAVQRAGWHPRAVSIFHSLSPKIDLKEVSQSNFLLL